MMATGAAQLVMAPIATFRERRVDPRLLIAVGYALLAVGLVGNGFMTFETDFWRLFGQRIVRRAAVMLCLLTSTALALSDFAPLHVPNASGLFNLMRKLGGAIGLALIDTALAGLRAGDASAARLARLPTERFTGVLTGEVDEATRALVAPLIERAGLVAAFIGLPIGGLAALSMLVLLVRARSRPGGSRSTCQP
jgi:DHA2 family multidrug resistance protein